MSIKQNILAKKYASAFWSLYQHELSESGKDDVLNNAVHFLRQNRIFYTVLSLPTISYKNQQELLVLLIQEFSLPSVYRKLFYILLEQKRITLLDSILTHIVRLQNKEEFIVTSSHVLTSDEKKRILQFIQSQVNTHVIAKFSVRSTLISGLRIQSNRYLWERSIKKTLLSIEQSLLRKGII